MLSDEAKKQIDYYRATAHLYEDRHVSPGDEHYIALNHISAFIRILGIKSVLDVGCGTGRGVKYFCEKHPELLVNGVEISADLLKVAVSKNGIPPARLVRGDGCFLPFQDGSLDSVVALGVLHHIKTPDQVVESMLRVARKAVFISDGNRYGVGALWRKLAKLAFFKLGTWKLVSHLKTYGRGYTFSEEDGIGFSYSVFDSLPLLRKRAKRIVAIPTAGDGDLSTIPLLGASHLLICAIKV